MGADAKNVLEKEKQTKKNIQLNILEINFVSIVETYGSTNFLLNREVFTEHEANVSILMG